MESNVNTRNIPGITIIHHAFVSMAFCARDIMLPQETVSAGRPMPRKLSVDSAAMAELMFITTMNITAERKFGIRCLTSIWKKPPPMHFEACTKSLDLSCRTSLLTILATLIQLVTPITTEIVNMLPAPSTA